MEALERSAVRRLTKKHMEQLSGNVVFNSMASGSTSGLAAMRLGDMIMVDGSIKANCSADVDVGGYTVRSVQHELTPRNAWETTAQVSSIPPEPTVKSWIWDAQENVRYEDLEDYIHSNGPHVKEAGFLDGLLDVID